MEKTRRKRKQVEHGKTRRRKREQVEHGKKKK
jgi:hypothetical protein